MQAVFQTPDLRSSKLKLEAMNSFGKASPTFHHTRAARGRRVSMGKSAQTVEELFAKWDIRSQKSPGYQRECQLLPVSRTRESKSSITSEVTVYVAMTPAVARAFGNGLIRPV